MLYVAKALGARNAQRVAAGLIVGVPVKMATTGLHSTFPSVQFLAALDGFALPYFMVSMVAIAFLRVAFGGSLVDDRTLGEVRNMEYALAKGEFDKKQRQELWAKWLAAHFQADQPARHVKGRLDSSSE
ncbi:MAG: hypothetical protein JOY90_23765 [Bradyrhizobium sp.]|uniref:hypothetical protein n=1 Tax=Bradyrhizobium sp. TaxID=376 RepID=UPI001D69836F|nr:hypothetical protein [Bradyrhizobium sp.]MBV9563435.1 hypothetical protein [Bradyrhizobium sp.]